MAAPTGARRISYSQARRLLLAAGVGILLIVAAVMFIRRVDAVEVGATLLFMVVFLGFLFWKLPGGLIGALVASAGYVALRLPAIEKIGTERFAGLIASRTVAYLVFGLVGGYANRILESSLTKLEIYDQIDDATGLFNSRHFLTETDLEMSRAQRYQKIFSVAVVDIPGESFTGGSRRQGAGGLREVSRFLQESVRTVDRAFHANGQTHHRFAVVLPETANEGAQIFTERLADQMTELMNRKGERVRRGDVKASWVTFPGDEERMAALREEFAAIARLEHPEETTAGAGEESPGE